MYHDRRHAMSFFLREEEEEGTHAQTVQTNVLRVPLPRLCKMKPRICVDAFGMRALEHWGMQEELEQEATLASYRS